MLKQTHAQYLGDERRTIKVSYVITVRQCVFTATTRIPSSINAAECIIEKICQVEKKAPQGLRFFDLQTHLGYESKKPGTYELDELIFSVTNDGKVTVTGWNPTSFLPKKHNPFGNLVGTRL